MLHDLAADASVAACTLQRVVSLPERYAKLPEKNELTWSHHHRVPLQLHSEAERSFHERTAVDQTLSARELRHAIAALDLITKRVARSASL